MVRENDVRAAELAVTPPVARDAGLVFIGRIRMPWTSRMDTPRQGRLKKPVCQIEVIYWLHLSRRDLVLQSPANDGTSRGTFSLRSPVRSNPLGASIARLVDTEGDVIRVQGLDCVDGTPLRDIKPDRTLFSPIAPAQAGDFQVGENFGS